MSDQKKEEYILSRRDALKTLVAVTGATTISTISRKWEPPYLDVGVLPAFAQGSQPTSGVDYPFTSEVDVDPADALLFSNRGWLTVNINNGIPGPPTVVTSADHNIDIQTIPLRRPFPSVPPSWNPVSDITIPYRFISTKGAIPEDGTVIWLYGVSDDGSFEGAIEGVVLNGLVTFEYPAPNPYSGAFYLSANFRNKEIILTDGTQIDSTFYFATGIFGKNAPQESVGSDCTDGTKSPVDVMLLVQLSSGFATDAAAKSAMKNFVDKLDLSTSQVGIIIYGNDDAGLANPLTQDGDLVKATIDELAFIGGFNNQGLPIRLARQELTGSNHKPNNTPVIIMLSTGEQLRSLRPFDGRIEANAAKEAGIRIITVGMAPGFPNDELLISWASSEADYYEAISSVNLVAIYDEISEIVGCPFENVPGNDDGGDDGGGGGGGGRVHFRRAVTLTQSIPIEGVQAGQTIEVSATGSLLHWAVSLWSPNDTVLGRIAGGSNPNVIRATASVAGTYTLKLSSTATDPVGQAVIIDGYYEVT
ncbi:MAG: VWA domain-containing protein [Anaerolineaceae bacterium]|nr:VWA domain-containing protein [Anaerolineae bacterium]MCB9079651.1 VWA domain-containing protein [Anaerolineaceae bacterium]